MGGIFNMRDRKKIELKIKEFKQSLTREQIESLRERSFVVTSKDPPKLVKKTPPKKKIVEKPKNPYCTSDYRYRDWKQIYLQTKQEELDPFLNKKSVFNMTSKYSALVNSSFNLSPNENNSSHYVSQNQNYINQQKSNGKRSSAIDNRSTNNVTLTAIGDGDKFMNSRMSLEQQYYQQHSNYYLNNTLSHKYTNNSYKKKIDSLFLKQNEDSRTYLFDVGQVYTSSMNHLPEYYQQQVYSNERNSIFNSKLSLQQRVQKINSNGNDSRNQQIMIKSGINSKVRLQSATVKKYGTCQISSSSNRRRNINTYL